MDLGIFFLSVWVNSLSQLNGMVMLRSAASGSGTCRPPALHSGLAEWTPRPEARSFCW